MARGIWEATSFVYSHSLMLVFGFRKIFWTSLCHTLSLSVDFSLSRCRVEVTQIGGRLKLKLLLKRWRFIFQTGKRVSAWDDDPTSTSYFLSGSGASGKRIAIQDTGSVHGWVLASVWWINPKLPGVFKSVHFFSFLIRLMIPDIFNSFSFCIEIAKQQLSQVSVVSSSGEALVRIIEKDGEFSDLTFFLERWKQRCFNG